MSKYTYIQLLQTAEDERTAILAIRQLNRYLEDPAILNLLCAFAVATDNPNLRAALIKTLMGRATSAASRFSQYVHRSRNPRIRRWALINLGLMECRSEPEAILEGLRDAHKSVRMAAATNAGLYREPAVLSALEDFYEKHRFDLVRECLQQAFRPALQAFRSPDPGHPSPLEWGETTV